MQRPAPVSERGARERVSYPAALTAPVRREPDAGRAQVAGPAAIARVALLTLSVLAEIILLLIALVPQSEWAARGLPDGPLPRPLYPLVAGLFYVLPALTGLLARRWQIAVLLATLPAWLDLGAFAVAAAARIGPFYLAQEPHASGAVGTLELFAALGALGWLARTGLLMSLNQAKAGRT
jgi:hypothetical protein